MISVEVSTDGTTVFIDGDPDARNHITVRQKFNQNTGPFYEISDPDGVAVVPPGCSREDANTIRCPTQGITGITILGGSLDDTIIVDITSPLAINIHTFDGHDITTAGPGPDVQNGGPGNDTQHGGGGDDKQIGGPGNDTQSGQAGNDRQLGGPGNDNQKGGAGKDVQNCGAGTNDKGVGGGGDDKSKGCEKGKP